MCNLHLITTNQGSPRFPVRRQPAADAWRIPGLSGAGGAQRRNLSRNGTDAVGNATTTTGLRIPGDEYQEYLVAALARLAESGKNRCLVPANCLAEYAPAAYATQLPNGFHRRN
jgi:hypothetical protein